jgi:tetratricopeptide (TPR) repeat protein
MRLGAVLRAGLVLLAVAGVGCERQPQKTAAGGSVAADTGSLRPVPLPDISHLATGVRTQVAQQHASMTRAVAQPGTAAADRMTAYADMGKLFMATELYAAAEPCFENARALAPADMRWPYYLGHVARLSNDPRTAATRFEQALTLQPDHVPTLVWLAEMHLARNEPERARPLLAKAQSLAPREAAVLYGLGRVALEARQYADAVRYLEGVLALAPEGSRAQYPLAMAYRGLGDTRQAEAHLRLRGEVDVQPADVLMSELAGLLTNTAAYETAGVQAMDAHRWPDAVGNLRKAAEQAPDNALIRLNLGTSLYMSSDADGALEQYKEAVRLSPSLAKAHFGIGVIMETRRRDTEAIAAFSHAVQGDPGFIEARFSLANALRRSGRVRESLPHYLEVIRASPSVSQASFGYAMGLVRLGRFQEARDRLERDVKTFPDQPGISHALARLLAAAPDDRVRDGARALRLMGELEKSQPRTLAMTETLAMALAEVGRFDEAARWQREALDAARSSGRADMAAHLADNLRLYEARRPCRTPWSDDDPVHHPEPSR